uniref:Tc1-like transposase DDE domain-containing protein n=1 Tax=Acrobeloides nanus TaxID=290746 RepID=A0A914CHP0_9BILA
MKKAPALKEVHKRRRLEWARQNMNHDWSKVRGPRSTRAWLERHQVRVLPWPACSPDQNLIENIWGILVRRIYVDNKTYQTKEALMEAIQEAWEDLDQEMIGNLVLSIPNRIFQLIQRNGSPTDY